MNVQAAIAAQAPLTDRWSPVADRQDEPTTQIEHQADLPYYARRNPDGFYTYQGRPLRSVTTYQSYAPGSHLIPWAGKQAMLEAISFLCRAGVQTDDPVIIEHCKGVIGDRLGMDEALAEIMDWRRRMIAHERYRDHKGRIGSLGHHYIYSQAMQTLAPDICQSKEETLGWLWQEAIKLRLFQRAKDQDYQPTEEQLDSLINSAYAYVLSADEWLRTARPRWSMVGQEAMVVRLSRDGDGIEYAGTVDGHLELHREDYGYKWEAEWPENAVSLWEDTKHSNSINHKMVQAQVAAYEDSDKIVLLRGGAEVEEFDVPKSDFIASLHIGPHPSCLDIVDEYGTLESKSQQTGPKLYTYPRDPIVLQGFHGLCRWVDYCENVPRAHQQRQKSTESPARIPKTEARPCPF